MGFSVALAAELDFLVQFFLNVDYYIRFSVALAAECDFFVRSFLLIASAQKVGLPFFLLCTSLLVGLY